MPVLSCIVCSSEVWIKPAEAHYRKTCSRACQGKGRSLGLIRSTSRSIASIERKCAGCTKVLPIGDFNKRSWRCKECQAAQNAEWREKNKEREKVKHAEKHKRVRKELLGHYSNGSFCCVCCGESEDKFLTLDHVNNDGASHRRELKSAGSIALHRWITQHHYPPILQVLCFNCNCGRRLNGGVCPHQGKEKHHATSSEVVPGSAS